MKKQLIIRGLIGFPVGVCICNIILLVISFCLGAYYVCAPECAQLFGSEIAGATAQFLLSGVVGTVFAAASVIWEIESWSLLRATVTHFFVTAIVFLPVSGLLGWTSLDLKGQISYFFIFVFIYICIWISQYFAYKKKIQKINQALKK